MTHTLLRLVPVAILLAVATTLAADDGIATAGRRGQALGGQLQAAARIPEFREGTGQHAAGEVVLPGQGPVSVNEFVPGADPSHVDVLKALTEQGDRRRLEEAGREHLREIRSDASLQGETLRITTNDLVIARDDLAADEALWAQSVNALSAPSSLVTGFSGCRVETRFDALGNEPAYVANEQVCEDVRVLNTCERTRELDLQAVEVQVLGIDTSISASVRLPAPIEPHVPSGHRLATADLTIEWEGDVASVTIAEPPSAANGWIAQLEVSFRPEGPPAQGVRASYAGTLTVLRETLSGDCLVASDGFCSARWTCEDSRLREFNGKPMDSAITALLQPLYPASTGNQPSSSEAPICWRATAQYDCPFNLGEMQCWDSPQGHRCHTNRADNTRRNTCAALAADPTCHEVRRSCAEDAVGHGGFCYVMSHLYECRKSVAVDRLVSSSRYECGDTLRCMGDDCFAPPQERPDSLAKAQTMLSITQHLLTDYTMVGTGRTRASATPGVLFLPGRAYECRKALGGVLDTCTQTDTGGIRDWMALYARHERQANATIVEQRARDAGGPALGAWHTLLDPSNASLGVLEKPLTSDRENVLAGQALPATTGPLGQTPQLQHVADAYRAQARVKYSNSLATFVGTAAEWELANQKEMGACLTVGSYCKRSVLGACIEKRETSCCFNSPLSRLMREQLAGPHGVEQGAFGTPRSPQCGGVAQEKLTSVDWGSMPTEEWIGRLAVGDVLPPSADIQARFDIDLLTGSESSLGQPRRANAQTRAKQRVSTLQPAPIRAKVATEAAGYVPRPSGEPVVAGEITFAPAFYTAVPGRSVLIGVARRGGSTGRVSVRYQSVDRSAVHGVHYVGREGELVWADGERGFKYIDIRLTRIEGRYEQPLEFQLRLVEPEKGARLGANDMATVRFVFEVAGN